MKKKSDIPPTEEYLSTAVSDFETAVGHLRDAENSLRALEDMLDGCLERLRRVATGKTWKGQESRI